MVAKFLTRLLILAALWSVLTGGDERAWLFGGPVITFASAWRLRAAGVTSHRLRPWRLACFVPYLLWRSFTGSCDVAWRAFHWRLPIAPVVRTYTFRLPTGSPARVVFANCVNLLPGTLASSWTEDVLGIHVLTDSPETFAALQQLERQVALLFGHRWELCEESEDQ